MCFVDSPAIAASVPLLSLERMVDNTTRSFFLALFFRGFENTRLFPGPSPHELEKFSEFGARKMI